MTDTEKSTGATSAPSSGMPLILLCAICGLIALVAAVVIPTVLQSRYAASEQSPLTVLKEYAVAEAMYFKQHGRYAQSFAVLIESGLLSEHFKPSAEDADATGAYMGAVCRVVRLRDGAPLDAATEFAACAFPAAYQRSGVNTFFVDQTGRVLMKDNGGNPVKDCSEIDFSWMVP